VLKLRGHPLSHRGLGTQQRLQRTVGERIAQLEGHTAEGIYEALRTAWTRRGAAS
jgi:hypothetical protein